ncbi:MAG TPA: hypothetical protein VFH43_04800 [Candidatus Kapabacteria bacterium]|nr:hypothetical protein [Candidatus Kapabacteria bacterium]
MITRKNTMHTSGSSTSGTWQGVALVLREVAVRMSSAVAVLMDSWFTGLDTILKDLASGQSQTPKLVPITKRIDDQNRPRNTRHITNC